MRLAATLVVLFAVFVSSCGSTDESTPPQDSTQTSRPPTSAPTAGPIEAPAWTEEEVVFSFGDDQIFGVLTMPSTPGPTPAVVLLSGSGDFEGIRSGSETKVFVDHSHRLAAEGFAVLRYDPPGVGRSTGGAAIPSLEERVEETHSAIQYLQSLPTIADESIGLMGWSQGPWVMAMTTVRYPDEVAFLVSVVGSGQSVANQQVFGIRAQSQAAGLPDEDVARAVLFGQLLIDWQLPDPLFEETSRSQAAELGDGPWSSFLELVHDAHGLSPSEEVDAVAELLRSAREERWAFALYLDLYLARFESLPDNISPEEMAALRTVMADNLLLDPEDFLTEVQIPVLAFFGEEDLNVDSERSPALFEKYLADAGNPDYTIVVIPDVGHNLGLTTLGYWEALSEWLRQRFIIPE